MGKMNRTAELLRATQATIEAIWKGLAEFFERWGVLRMPSASTSVAWAHAEPLEKRVLLTTTTLDVDATATGTGSGLSWANAYPSLATALSYASSHASSSNYYVLDVAEGTYLPTTGTSEPATFQLTNYVTIYGGYPSGGGTRNVAADPTILSGAISGGNSYHVVTGSGTWWYLAVLDGVTIEDGIAGGGDGENEGAGLYNVDGSPTINDCTFVNNSALNGGAMENYGGSSPTITDCTFSNNSATDNGGAIQDDNSVSPTFSDCTFTSNYAGYEGGAAYSESYTTFWNCVFSDDSAAIYGGAFAQEEGSAAMTGCTFSGDNTPYFGGAVESESGTLTLSDCTFTGNHCDYGIGGAILSFGDLEITGCTFSGDTAEWSGGAIWDDSNTTIVDSTFTGNTSDYYGGAICNSVGNQNITNSIFEDNQVTVLIRPLFI